MYLSVYIVFQKMCSWVPQVVNIQSGLLFLWFIYYSRDYNNLTVVSFSEWDWGFIKSRSFKHGRNRSKMWETNKSRSFDRFGHLEQWTDGNVKHICHWKSIRLDNGYWMEQTSKLMSVTTLWQFCVVDRWSIQHSTFNYLIDKFIYNK